MDPYRTLGVDRGCSRDDVKAAFRAMVRLAHPDRGGDEQTFILFCAAYKKILEDLPPSPSAQEPARAERNTNNPNRPAAKERPSPEAPRNPDPTEVRSKSPDLNWDPDLILAADVGRDGKPAPPPDPQWQADFVLHDEVNSHSPPQQPSEPTWRPSVVFLDESIEHYRAESGREPGRAREKYRSLFQRIFSRSTDEEMVDWESPLVRTIGILIFLALIVGNIWLCCMAWNADSDSAHPQTTERGTPMR
jgi:hypothetical protein